MLVARGLRASSCGWVCAGAALLSSSCVIEVNTDPRLAAPTEEEASEQHYNELVDEFNAGLQAFAGEAIAMNQAGDRVFWVGADKRLHSYDVSSMKRVDYELPIELGVYPSFEAGTDVIVIAKYSSDAWQISAYAADEPNTLIDTITWPWETVVSEFGFTNPPPIAIEDSSLYLIDPESVLHRWRLGMGAPEPLFSLTDRGLVLGMVPRLSVHGDDVLVLDNAVVGWSIDEAGALWHVRLSGGEAQQVAGSAFGVCFQAGEALYAVWEEEVGPAFFRYASWDHQTENLNTLVHETGVDLGDLDVDSDHLTQIFQVDCQPGGFTFQTGRGLFFFDRKESEAQALHLEKYYNPDEWSVTDYFANFREHTSTTYYGAEVIEHVAFVSLTPCTVTVGTSTVCPLGELYRRDLSAH